MLFKGDNSRQKRREELKRVGERSEFMILENERETQMVGREIGRR